ncbi:MAG: substrate-binding domain-containing protein, partial [Clostridia bacterium]|nr:substrate-binding domain-containing protein [Clostridia bacterium]
MDPRPTAIFTSEDLIACGILKRFQELGFSVPEDISLVGFDNSEPSKIVTPMLTTVNQFIRRKADCAVEMLLRAMEDPTYRKDQKMIDVDLVRRSTVAHIG